jgi:NTP pyrophosphatase (non-canonical NTP hydrolase)
MNQKQPLPINCDFAAATERAMRIRKLYHQLEEQNHKTIWTTEEDMLAFVSDVGILARLVMATEGRWIHGGDINTELKDKVAECLWWLLVLSDRLSIDITHEYNSFIDKIDTELDV